MFRRLLFASRPGNAKVEHGPECSATRLFVQLCLASIALIAFPQVAFAQITYTNSTDGTVNETATPCTAPLLRTFSVPQIYSVADINIGVVMSHTYRGDLRMFLLSPLGTQITLIQNTGASRDNFNVLYDDSAAASITTHTASNDTATAGTVAPLINAHFVRFRRYPHLTGRMPMAPGPCRFATVWTLTRAPFSTRRW